MTPDQLLTIGQRLKVTLWREGSGGKKEKEESFDSFIKDLDSCQGCPRILIDPPPVIREELIKALQPGVDIRATVFTQQGKLVFYPEIREVQQHGLYGYWLSLPPAMDYEFVQERQHVRIPVIRPLQVERRVPERNIEVERVRSSASGEKGPVICKTLNLSGGGLRFLSARAFVAGEELLLRFEVDQELLALKGRVVYFEEGQNERLPDEVVYLVSVQFEDLPEKTEVKLINECFRLELESRRKGLA